MTKTDEQLAEANRRDAEIADAKCLERFRAQGLDNWVVRKGMRFTFTSERLPEITATVEVVGIRARDEFVVKLVPQ